MADETPAAGTPEPQIPETPAVDPVAAERARIASIMDRCNAVGMSELAQAAIVDGLTMDQLNARIVDAYTARGGTELRSAVPDGPTPVDTAAIERRIFNQVAVGGIR